MTTHSPSESLSSVVRAETPDDIEAVRQLIRSFVQWTTTEIAPSDNPAIFAGLETELAGLPGRYGAPTGCLVLARLDGEPAGCVAFYAQDAETIEIKRMFVLPQSRGHGIGDRMLDVLLTQARSAGYRRARLSSHHSMHAAHAIYRRAGFRDVSVSAEFPSAVIGVDVCMEMALNGVTVE
ncbi:GNAT family N-acetyltransferase [Leptothrix sp. BB-4]